MTAPQDSPPGVDPSRPSPARVYDYLLGGDNNFESDRAAAELLKSRAPELVDSAYANRGFHQRAARWIAEHGVRQFIDIGSGLPTVGNTHEVVRRVVSAARVVYVDNDHSNSGCTHRPWDWRGNTPYCGRHPRQSSMPQLSLSEG